MKIVRFIFLFLAVSCSNDKNVLEFENTLGEENADFLTVLVFDFENNFLKSQYGNISVSQAYENFLIDIKNNIELDWESLDLIRNKFNESGFRNEVYQYPDSVWIETDTSKMVLKSNYPVVKSLYKYVNEDGSKEIYEEESSVPENFENLDINGLFERELSTPKFNLIGKYNKALYIVQNKNSFYKKFYEVKNSMHFFPAEQLAEFILNEKVNFDDYIIKRIILIEIVL